MNIKCIIAYDGGNYLGWQKTEAGPSIEETLEKILEKILQNKVALQAASRTDAGVHAEGQVINFFAEPADFQKFKRSFKSMLPEDIALISMEACEDTFHPTVDCVKKEYRYWIATEKYPYPHLLKTCWHVPKKLNLSLMSASAQKLIGTHDFSAFQNVSENPIKREPVCTIYEIAIEEMPDNRLLIRMTADNFLYKMARNIAGTLVDIGSEKIRTPIEEILASKERPLAGMTAPPQGLFLHKVFYP